MILCNCDDCIRSRKEYDELKKLYFKNLSFIDVAEEMRKVKTSVITYNTPFSSKVGIVFHPLFKSGKHAKRKIG